MRTLVTNGTIVTTSQATRADVLIEDDRIVEIAPSIVPVADRTIDASGKLVLPGGVDVHTHLDMPLGGISSSDDFESGTVAAACGGTTTIIDFATQKKGQKETGLGDFSKIPNGAPGIEFRMSLLYDGGVRQGRLSLARFVDVTSTAPARVFGLYPRKGTIAPGSDADLVVFDPNRTARISAATHHMRVDYNPYEGREVTGIVETVLSRGRTIVEHGRFVGRAGAGAFLRRAARERQDLE
jgi:dihydroorotase-like cyclic amidohydrolase